MPSCRYHCRRCNGHFTSLAAFDAHHESSGENLVPCVFPDGHGLIEVAGGSCRISGTTAQVGTMLYSTETALGASEYFRAREAA